MERLGAQRVTADCSPGYPCRVSLAEAKIGEALILCNFEHLAEISPYRASHAIYVRSGAVQAVPAVGEVPSILLRRMLSVRGFGADHCIKTAEVIEGRTLSATIEAFFSKTVISYIHIHNAQHGCFAAKALRG
ncbi:MAG: hypothetical protein CMG97_03835 [Marinovum sp.]|nr:hypothetical protein [Marinovum sp.]